MELPIWQERAIETPTCTKVPYTAAEKFFAVDASGSTIGPVMRAQEKTVRQLHANPNDHVVLWSVSCKDPRPLDTVEAGYFS
ncbi:MAG: hypothetical protein Q9192_008380, partial [Flavoplaca navasiana]